jgi:ribosomal protein L37AE/L43A
MSGAAVVSRSQAVCPGCRKYVSKAEVDLGTCGRCGLNFNPGGTDGEVKSTGKAQAAGEAQSRTEKSHGGGPAAAAAGHADGGGPGGGGDPAPGAAAAASAKGVELPTRRRSWWW